MNNSEFRMANQTCEEVWFEGGPGWRPETPRERFLAICSAEEYDLLCLAERQAKEGYDLPLRALRRAGWPV